MIGTFDAISDGLTVKVMVKRRPRPSGSDRTPIPGDVDHGAVNWAVVR